MSSSSPAFQRVLAVETSCDDTSVSIVAHDGRVIELLAASQNQAHEPFGGIVPEIACRNHTYHLMPMIDQCLAKSALIWKDIDGLVVTSRPGLIGSLMVGLVTVKSLALALEKPFIGVNHLEGHLLAPFLRDDQYAPPREFDYPYIALAISGGHTSLYRIDGLGKYQVLGRTIDDAAGEAFDKFGKMAGLGFPGGVRVDRHAGASSNPGRFVFPRPLIHEEHLNFSFSGMKTAARKILDTLSAAEKSELADDLAFGKPRAGVLSDLCAGFQIAAVDVLLDRLARAVQAHGVKRAVLTGGVSANSFLRRRGEEWARENGVALVVPPIRYCTDNAAMIGYAGILRLNSGEVSDQTLAPEARATLGAAPLPANLPPWLKKAKA